MAATHARMAGLAAPAIPATGSAGAVWQAKSPRQSRLVQKRSGSAVVPRWMLQESPSRVITAVVLSIYRALSIAMADVPYKPLDVRQITAMCLSHNEL